VQHVKPWGRGLPVFCKGASGFVALFAVILLLSCTTRRTVDLSQQVSLETLLAEPGSKTVVVLPFENHTDEPGIEDLVRKSFYSHFSPKNYRDFEIGQVDRLLEFRGGGHTGNPKTLSATELGELFRADFVIYGEVLTYQKTFLGIYSQIALGVGLEMVSCRDGKGVWQRTLTKRSHDGGIPFSLFGVIPAALRSGLHLTEERAVGLVDQVSRELASAIPDPPDPPVPTRYLELQVASFLDPMRAEDTVLQFEAQGRKARIERVAVNGRTYHRVLLGPFVLPAEAEQLQARIARETDFQPIVIRHEAKVEVRKERTSP